MATAPDGAPTRPSADTMSAGDEASLVVFNRWVMLGGQAMFFTVCGLLWLYFRQTMPGAPLHLWGWIILGVAAIIAVYDISFMLRDPHQASLVAWRRVDNYHAMLFDVIGVGVIWLLLPHADEGQRLLIAAFCIGYVPCQMFSGPENAVGNRISIFAILGSFAVWAFMQDGSAYKILTVLVVLYGTLLFFSANWFRSVVVDTLMAQRSLERTNGALQLAIAQVSEERDARTRFIRSASHDLGQPIHAARLMVESAIKAQSGRLAGADASAHSLGRAVSALASAQGILGNLLYHMRLEADAVKPNFKPLDVSALVERIASRYESQVRFAGGRLVARSSRLSISSDSVLLERALANLLENAIRHARAQTIRIVAWPTRDTVCIHVIDDGVGVPVSEQVSIFDDYTRGSQAQEGFGLGLGSVRRIAQLLGGQARLAARRHRGSTFTIELPLAGMPA